MGTWKEYIKSLKYKWIGKNVLYDGKQYNVVDVDYNGILLINKKSKYNDTTAVAYWNVKII